MHYTTHIDIDLPRERVIELFDNPVNLPKWQSGLLSFEPVSGEPGRPGAKSRLRYRMGKREMEMIETITTRNLPHEFSGTYETPGVLNVQKNYFEEVAPDRTRWKTESEFRFNGWMRFVMPLMKGMFRKQTEQFMQQFKAFAETA